MTTEPRTATVTPSSTVPTPSGIEEQAVTVGSAIDDKPPFAVGQEYTRNESHFPCEHVAGADRARAAFKGGSIPPHQAFDQVVDFFTKAFEAVHEKLAAAEAKIEAMVRKAAKKGGGAE